MLSPPADLTTAPKSVVISLRGQTMLCEAVPVPDGSSELADGLPRNELQHARHRVSQGVRRRAQVLQELFVCRFRACDPEQA